jgi:predicted membrane channel-forming protein YqfA (hemolysin III family)
VNYLANIIKVVRKSLTIVVGSAQATLGASAIVLAFLLHINFFGLQTWLKIPPEFLPLQILVLIVFGVFSVISGLFLLTESIELP